MSMKESGLVPSGGSLLQPSQKSESLQQRHGHTSKRRVLNDTSSLNGRHQHRPYSDPAVQNRHQRLRSETYQMSQSTEIHFNTCFHLLEELFEKMKLELNPSGFRFLDVACAPGGFSQWLLDGAGNRAPCIEGFGITLPTELGGFEVMINPTGLATDSCNYSLCYYDLLSLPSWPLPSGVDSVDLVIADAQYLPGKEFQRRPYRGTRFSDSNVAKLALLISQFRLALEALADKGMFLFRLTAHPSLSENAFRLIMLCFDLFDSVEPFKSEYFHCIDSSFYLVCSRFKRHQYIQQQVFVSLSQGYADLFDAFVPQTIPPPCSPTIPLPWASLKREVEFFPPVSPISSSSCCSYLTQSELFPSIKEEDENRRVFFPVHHQNQQQLTFMSSNPILPVLYHEQCEPPSSQTTDCYCCCCYTVLAPLPPPPPPPPPQPSRNPHSCPTLNSCCPSPVPLHSSNPYYHLSFPHSSFVPSICIPDSSCHMAGNVISGSTFDDVLLPSSCDYALGGTVPSGYACTCSLINEPVVSLLDESSLQQPLPIPRRDGRSPTRSEHASLMVEHPSTERIGVKDDSLTPSSHIPSPVLRNSLRVANVPAAEENQELACGQIEEQRLKEKSSHRSTWRAILFPPLPPSNRINEFILEAEQQRLHRLQQERKLGLPKGIRLSATRSVSVQRDSCSSPQSNDLRGFTPSHQEHSNSNRSNNKTRAQSYSHGLTLSLLQKSFAGTPRSHKSFSVAPEHVTPESKRSPPCGLERSTRGSQKSLPSSVSESPMASHKDMLSIVSLPDMSNSGSLLARAMDEVSETLGSDCLTAGAAPHYLSLTSVSFVPDSSVSHCLSEPSMSDLPPKPKPASSDQNPRGGQISVALVTCPTEIPQCNRSEQTKSDPSDPSTDPLDSLDSHENERPTRITTLEKRAKKEPPILYRIYPLVSSSNWYFDKVVSMFEFVFRMVAIGESNASLAWAQTHGPRLTAAARDTESKSNTRKSRHSISTYGRLAPTHLSQQAISRF